MDMESDALTPSQEETTGSLLASSIEVSDDSIFFEFERGLEDGGVTIPSSGEMDIIHSRGSAEDDLGFHNGELTARLPKVDCKSIMSLLYVDLKVYCKSTVLLP